MKNKIEIEEKIGVLKDEIKKGNYRLGNFDNLTVKDINDIEDNIWILEAQIIILNWVLS